MTNLLSFTKPETLKAIMAMTERRQPASGGPRDRQRHLTYQRTYQAFRCRFGVTLPTGHVLKYPSRKSADRVRRSVRALAHVQMPAELWCELAHIAFRNEARSVSDVLSLFARHQRMMAAALAFAA